MQGEAISGRVLTELILRKQGLIVHFYIFLGQNIRKNFGPVCRPINLLPFDIKRCIINMADGRGVKIYWEDSPCHHSII